MHATWPRETHLTVVLSQQQRGPSSFGQPSIDGRGAPGAGLQVNPPFLFSLKGFKYEALIKLFGAQVDTGLMDLLHVLLATGGETPLKWCWFTASEKKDLLEEMQFVWKGLICCSIAVTYRHFSERQRAANALELHFLYSQQGAWGLYLVHPISVFDQVCVLGMKNSIFQSLKHLACSI